MAEAIPATATVEFDIRFFAFIDGILIDSLSIDFPQGSDTSGGICTPGALNLGIGHTCTIEDGKMIVDWDTTALCPDEIEGIIQVRPNHDSLNFPITPSCSL